MKRGFNIRTFLNNYRPQDDDSNQKKDAKPVWNICSHIKIGLLSTFKHLMISNNSSCGSNNFKQIKERMEKIIINDASASRGQGVDLVTEVIFRTVERPMVTTVWSQRTILGDILLWEICSGITLDETTKAASEQGRFQRRNSGNILIRILLSWYGKMRELDIDDSNVSCKCG